jgi:hypothetical protein
MSAEPVASRGGLIVLRHRVNYHVRVCNALTGRASLLPPSHVSGDYPHALLAVGDAGGSFQLLVADVSLRTQVFSSDAGSWGPVVELANLPPRLPRSAPHRGSHPVVLGGGTAVHWLHGYRSIVRLDTDKAQATLMELPPNCASMMRSLPYGHRALRLAASADGELSLLVAEARVISMWTVSAAAAEGRPSSSSAMSAPAARWTRQVVIRREAIGREDMNGGFSAQFLGFGELSSTAILLMEQIGLVRIDLRTKEALVLGSDGFKGVDAGELQLCLHETDLPSLLRAMRSF